MQFNLFSTPISTWILYIVTQANPPFAEIYSFYGPNCNEIYGFYGPKTSKYLHIYGRKNCKKAEDFVSACMCTGMCVSE